MRLLVTGGSGFIGSNFIRYLLEHYGPEMITNVDSLTTGRLANLDGVAGTYGERYEFLQADVADPDRIEAVLAKHQFFAVVHCAAEASGVAGTMALLERARRHGVRRFLLVSKEHDEGRLRPVEAAVLEGHGSHGEEVVIARSTDTYGPFQPATGFIPATIMHALRDDLVPVVGDGTHLRDWLHVQDHCSALFAALLDGVPGSIYRFSSGHAMRDIDVAQRILEYLGKSRDLIEFFPDPVEKTLAAEAAPEVALPPEQTPEPLAWKPRRPLEQGLRETIDWYVRNREWWDPVPQR